MNKKNVSPRRLFGRRVHSIKPLRKARLNISKRGRDRRYRDTPRGDDTGFKITQKREGRRNETRRRRDWIKA